MESPAPPAVTPAAIATGVILAALGVLAILLRIGIGTSIHSLWAEDGTVLLATALRHDLIAGIGTLYLGNLEVPRRVVGEVAADVPLSSAPAIFALAGNAVVVACAFIVWRTSAGHIRDPFLRGALAALVVLAPTAGLESVDDTDYTGFYTLFATFWLLLWRPRSTASAAAAGGFALLTALDTPLAAVLVPVALLSLIAARDRRDLIVPLALIGGAVVQTAIYALHRSAAPASGWSWHALEAYVQRVLAAGPLGQRIAGGLWEVAGWGFLAVVVVAAAALLVLALRRPSRRGRDFVVLAFTFSVATFLVAAYTRDAGAVLAWPGGSYDALAARYTILPALLLVSAILVQLDIEPAPARRRAWTGSVAATLALLTAGVATSFSVADTAARGTPSWSSAIDAGRQTCLQSRTEAAKVPISPPGWSVRLPCRSLEVDRAERFATP